MSRTAPAQAMQMQVAAPVPPSTEPPVDRPVFVPGRSAVSLAPPEQPAAHARIGEIVGRVVGSSAWIRVAEGGASSPGDLNAGRGLTKTGDVLDLDIAGAALANLGGVFVAARSATQGLVNTGGLLTAPIATSALAGVLIDALDDGHTYVRKGGAWSLGALADSFIWTTPLVLDGTEVGDPATGTERIFTVPAAALPTVPFDYMVGGTGIGTFYVTNRGLGAQPLLSDNFNIYVELIFDSASWILIASQQLTPTNIPADDILLRSVSQAPGSQRLFHFDPETQTGIRFMVRFTNVIAGSTGRVVLGIQGQVLPAP